MSIVNRYYLFNQRTMFFIFHKVDSEDIKDFNFEARKERKAFKKWLNSYDNKASSVEFLDSDFTCSQLLSIIVNTLDIKSTNRLQIKDSKLKKEEYIIIKSYDNEGDLRGFTIITPVGNSILFTKVRDKEISIIYS